jgi:hypothetical protein
MTRATQETADTTTSTATTEAGAPRTRRGRGRRRVGRWVRPVYPMRAYYEAASEDEKRKAHLLSAIILEYWTGVKTKSEAATALSVPPIRVWQMSQRAATGLVCALLTPPSGKRGPPMATSEEEKALLKRMARIEKENALLRELVAVLRELPGNRDRQLPPALQEAAKEAEAGKPRKTKSKAGSRTLPGGAGVDSAPSS